MSALFSPTEIAHLLSEDGQTPLIPTAEQAEIIETPPQGTVLVIAGAGSGKTETIASRVLWLVVNGHVRPQHILGLTFTRKAAGELAERVRNRLLTFVARAEGRSVTPAQRTQLDELRRAMHDELDLPEVSTYNSFAAGIVQEFASTVGADARLIDEAVAWNIARDVVLASTDARLPKLNLSVNTITERVLQFEHAIHDHLSSFDTAATALKQRARVLQLPYNDAALAHGSHDGKTYADIRKIVADAEQTEVIADLARAYHDEKRAHGVMEFSDQVAHALTAVDTTPEAVELLRQRHRMVLLDEVQDTSVAQTRLLARLFTGQHLMGVGDPHQSIYGWRGASSESLNGFHFAFRSTEATARTLNLSTSWRNARAVLAVANRAAAPLSAETAVPVPTLVPRTGAPAGQVEVRIDETLDDELQQISTWLHAQRHRYASTHDGAIPTAAVIVRKRKYMPKIAQHLTASGIANRIIGVGGLLETPEVADVISALRCVANADADHALLRILAGPRFAVGTADIAALRHVANWFRNRDHTHRRLPHEQLATNGVLDRVEHSVTLVEALDVLTRVPRDHRALAPISNAGYERCRAAADMFNRLRALREGPVHDLMYAVTRELNTDIELESLGDTDSSDRAQGLENLHHLHEEVRNFLATAPEQGLSAVLTWLDTVQTDDDKPAYVPPPTPGTVQIITTHSAKGLEWDCVVVAQQMQGEFPTTPRSTQGELAAGVIPDVCRGDRHSRPVLDLDGVTTQKEFLERVKTYKHEHARQHENEELRLLYVAYTRAKHALLCTGSFWGSAKKPRPVSHTLHALRGVYEHRYAGLTQGEALVDEFLEASAHDTHPQGDAHTGVVWPLDPLGARRPGVEQAAAAVREAPETSEGDETTQLLLQEHLNSSEPTPEDLRFERVNASAFHDIIHDPGRAREHLLRPLPTQPFRNTRVGTLFHEWVEQRTTTAVGGQLTLDTEPAFNGIPESEQQQLRHLISVFERSRWAAKQPFMVEELITLPFAGIRVSCKLDAVYFDGGTYEIVDWKTGRMPNTEQERAERFLQLDLYRAALAQLLQVPHDKIVSTLFYVDVDEEITSHTGRTLHELEELWGTVQPRGGSSGPPEG